MAHGIVYFGICIVALGLGVSCQGSIDKRHVSESGGSLNTPLLLNWLLRLEKDVNELQEEVEELVEKDEALEEKIARLDEKQEETSQPGSSGHKSSCKDIYISQRTPTSGVYTIHSRSGLISVFCDFYEGQGYMYISKHDIGKLNNLSRLYTEDDHAIVRILYHNGEQHAVSIEQLSDYKYRYQLSFQLSDADGYKRPLNHGLAPYIYVGFLPHDFASLKSETKPAVQGYRAAGTDFRFHNCDKNPNSYLAFFANPNNQPDNPYCQRCCDNKFMREWISKAQLIPKARYMPEEFYYMYEMHMGGCGGYLSTSHTASIVKGAALGIGFKLEEYKCKLH